MWPQHLKNNDPWTLAEDIPDMDLFFSQIWLNCFVNRFGEQTGRAYSKILCKYQGYHLWFYFGEKDSFEVGESIVRRIVNEPGYARRVNQNIIKQADKLRTFCQKIPQKNLDKLSDKQLWKIYDRQDKIHKEYYTWCWIPVAADMFHNNLTRRVKEYLRGLGIDEGKVNEYFIVLTQPTKKSLIYIEQEELLRIAARIETGCLPLPEGEAGGGGSAVENHRRKYYYTKHLWVKGEYTFNDYWKQIKDALGQPGGVRAALAKMREDFKNNKLKRNQLIKKLKVDKKWQDIFIAFGDFMVTKIYRRYAQIFAVHHMSAVLKEIARRKCLTEKQVRFMLPSEIKKLLLENKYNARELNERTTRCVYYAERGYDKVFVGQEAAKLLKTAERTVGANIQELRGEIGCPGQARGKVKIIIRAQDMGKMNKGDILVSIATDPDIVPAMKKAAAIVTEQGGVTSHAAIVSREFKIPCVIGTKIATRVLKDGDIVEVDANKGIIKKI